MKIEEKKDALVKHCVEHKKCITDDGITCPLWTHAFLKGIPCYAGATPEQIEHNYELVFGKEEAEKVDEPKEMVDHPSHYNQGDMECIDEMELIFGVEAVMDFCVCNAWKYRARAAYKGNPEEDMAKANWYLNKYKELMEREYK